jgi:hypothetical protein
MSVVAPSGRHLYHPPSAAPGSESDDDPLCASQNFASGRGRPPHRIRRICTGHLAAQYAKHVQVKSVILGN